MLTVQLDDIWAEAGAINVRADVLQGAATGLADAPRDASVTITNNTPAFLEVGDITIPESIGGLYFNGVEVTSIADINDLNDPDDDVTAGTVAIVIPVGNTADPIISIRTNAPDNIPADESYPVPAITVVGDVDNLSGTVVIENFAGPGADIIFRGAVRAENLTVVASGSVFIDGVTSYSVGGEPYSQWRPVTTITEAAKAETADSGTAVTAILGTTPNAVNLYGDKVFINAQYLNINGILQSGKSDYVVDIGAAANNEIQQIKSSKKVGRLNLKSVSTADFTVRFDTATNQIEVEEVRVGGGNIEIEARVLNTGNGEIRLLGGYGHVAVNNTTPYDVVLQRIDVSQRGAGILKITDLAKQVQGTSQETVYLKTENGVQITQLNGPDSRDDVTVPGSDTETYTPANDWRYGWSVGQEKYVRRYKLVASSAWAGIDALSKDPETETWDTVENVGTPVLMDEGPYYFLGAGDDYTYAYTNQQLASTTYVADSWTESEWYGTKTYYQEIVNETREVDISTHSIKANRPITIKFIGYDEGGVTVNSSKGHVVVDGPILNPTGVTTITASQGQIKQQGDDAVIGGRRIDLVAAAGIGLGDALTVNLADVTNASLAGARPRRAMCISPSSPATCRWTRSRPQRVTMSR